MAVFGAPVAHEDDPERAVRAALAIRDWARETGERAPGAHRRQHRRGARRARRAAREGEGMAAGDVVNTAARLQTAAPVNGVLVGEATYRATRARDRVREAEPVVAKGKAEPVRSGRRCARPRRASSVEPSRPRAARRPRAASSTLLVGALAARAPRARAAARHARRRARDRQEPARRRALRASSTRDAELIRVAAGPLPRRTATASAFWALGEIVKAQAGILDSDSRARRRAKLARPSGSASPTRPSATGSQRSLAPLVGPATRRARRRARARRSPPGGASSRRWRSSARSCSSSRICTGPTTSCSTSSTSSSTGSTGVPLLVVCTARPELLERRPAGAAASATRSTVSLSPLDERRHGAARRGAARPGAAAGGDASGAARARRRQPALRRAVRAHARGTRRGHRACRRRCRGSSRRGSTCSRPTRRRCSRTPP